MYSRQIIDRHNAYKGEHSDKFEGYYVVYEMISDDKDYKLSLSPCDKVKLKDRISHARRNSRFSPVYAIRVKFKKRGYLGVTFL